MASRGLWDEKGEKKDYWKEEKMQWQEDLPLSKLSKVKQRHRPGGGKVKKGTPRRNPMEGYRVKIWGLDGGLDVTSIEAWGGGRNVEGREGGRLGQQEQGGKLGETGRLVSVGRK